MEYFVIKGGNELSGEIEVSGMKNAAVGVIFACLLTEEKCVLENIPDISDVRTSFSILKAMGAKIRYLNKTTVEIDCKNAEGGCAPFELVRNMRASYYLAGAELGRFGKTRVGCPGGCDFGIRPIDQHIKGFEALGAEVSVEGGYIEGKATDGRLRGANIYFDRVSVGATINVLIAAALADGNTIIENAAREPHVVDLANFLNSCGAKITGAGTDVIKVKGVTSLTGCTYAIIPDMIEAGTYMIAAAATNSCLKITNVIPKHLESISAKLEEMGVTVEEQDDFVVVTAAKNLTKTNIRTMPYPGFPTDMNPQICTLLCLAEGVSYLTESVWDSRFRYIEELRKMGADIKVNGKTAVIEGNTRFVAAPIRAVDLRAGAAMIIAGLCANGKTTVEDIHHIKRGYDDIAGKLRLVGADIREINVPEISNYPKAN
ncbi:MAG: UDP-N-acetylglucosamine 1-carboxyvinyltransferase [Clostridia bacterium]|nr:UDP-N-acetylglucosamine 1-carboxyvinyltransferase [Clostridia bacterium]